MIDPRVPLKTFSALVFACYATSSSAQEVELPQVGDLQAALTAPEPLSEDPDELLDQLSAETDPVEAARLSKEILERWSHSGSDAMDLLMQRADAAIEAEEYSRAIAHLTALTDHAPEFAEAWNKRAEVFYMMDELGAALTDIEQVLILEPRHFGALIGLGFILESMGQEAAALRAFRTAQDIYPTEENINNAVQRLENKTGGRAL